MERRTFYRDRFSPGVLSTLSWLLEILSSLGDGPLPQPQRRTQPAASNGDVGPLPVIAVTGLRAEASIATGRQIVTLSGCGDAPGLAQRLETVAAHGASAIISFGVAGGLAPGIAPGTVLVARTVIAEDGARYDSDRAWARRLSATLSGAMVADIAGIDLPVSGIAERRDLYRKTGALAADTESHVAARVATAFGLPLAVFRVVADPAYRQLPHAALVAIRPDGSLAVDAILGSLLRNPRQLPQLMRTANDARAAFVALFRGRMMLAHSLGFGDSRELPLELPAEEVVGGPLPV